MSSNLFDSPSTWARTTLGEVFQIVSGSTPKTEKKEFFTDSDGTPWFTPADLSHNKNRYVTRGRRNLTELGLASCSLKVLPKGSVLFSSRAPIGHIAIANTDVTTNQGFKSLSMPSSGIHSEFAYFYLKAITPYIQSKGSGTTFKEVSAEVMKNIPFLIPPLQEQHRIVAKIESTFQKIDSIEKSVTEAEKLLKKYRESLLAKAFRGELVPQDPNDEPASKLFDRIRAERAKQQGNKKKKDDLPPITEGEIPFEIPKSWVWVRLGELENLGILSLIEDGNHGELHPKACDYCESGIHFVMANNVRDGRLDLKTCKKLPKTITDKLRIGFAITGDVLLTHKGTIGQVAIVPKVTPYVMLTPQVTLYRIEGLRTIQNQWLRWSFCSPFFQRSLSSISKQATRDYVGITKQKMLLIPLAPLSEQSRIIEELELKYSHCDSFAHAIRSIFLLCKKSNESLLSHAFSGRLVPQIPSEGTGHDLLDQILKDKTASVPLTKLKKSILSEREQSDQPSKSPSHSRKRN